MPNMGSRFKLTSLPNMHKAATIWCAHPMSILCQYIRALLILCFLILTGDESSASELCSSCISATVPPSALKFPRPLVRNRLTLAKMSLFRLDLSKNLTASAPSNLPSWSTHDKHLTYTPSKENSAKVVGGVLPYLNTHACRYIVEPLTTTDPILYAMFPKVEWLLVYKQQLSQTGATPFSLSSPLMLTGTSLQHHNSVSLKCLPWDTTMHTAWVKILCVKIVTTLWSDLCIGELAEPR